MDFKIVKYNPDGDGQDALYIDGKLHFQGDWYHDKISTRIEAFLEGIAFAGIKFSKPKKYRVPDNDDGWFDFPENFDPTWKVMKK